MTSKAILCFFFFMCCYRFSICISSSSSSYVDVVADDDSSSYAIVVADDHSSSYDIVLADDDDDDDEAASNNGSSSAQGSSCSSLLFVFGASMADTGEYSSAVPYTTRADFPPYGLDYFPTPAGRWSNGRVFTDFLSQQLGYGILNPYMQSIDSNFTFGANFASAGSTAQSTSFINSFPTQINQFRRLIARQLHKNNMSSSGYSYEQIQDAIYVIETGNNDYVYQFAESLDFDADQLVRNVTNAIESGFRELYSIGARNFIVMALTPLGCAPSYSITSDEVDEYGCAIFYNRICELHNQHLEKLLSNLSQELDGNWIFFDAYSLFLDGYRNPSRYGIRFPLDACCGVAGQPHNYNPMVPCGTRGYINGTYRVARKCKDPSLYIIWDSIHPVESFARYMAEGVLTASYLKPSFNIRNACSKSNLHGNAKR